MCEGLGCRLRAGWGGGFRSDVVGGGVTPGTMLGSGAQLGEGGEVI
jgi:hypothetical protein